ncbi:centromere protein T [Sigmodon hispidus]
MAGRYSLDQDQTTRTLLLRVLDTADSRTPRRRQSAQTNAQRTVLQTPSSKRQRSQTKTTARRHSYRTRSVARLAQEQTPRTLLRNILLTAPESSVVMPDSVVKPAQAPEMVVESFRRESSPGSLELQLPELEFPSTLARGLPGTGKRKRKLSLFQQGMDQERPLSQEPPGNADVSSLTSSFNLSFAPPLQSQSVRRPGLARRRPIRRPVDVDFLLQGLKDDSLSSAVPGDNPRTPIATPPTDVALEDTRPFSQPSVGCSSRAYHSLPNPSHSGVEDAERVVGLRTRSTGTGLQRHLSRTSWRTAPSASSEPQPPELREALGFQEAVEANEPEGCSGDEETPGRPASPDLASSTYDLLQVEQPHRFVEPPSPTGDEPPSPSGDEPLSSSGDEPLSPSGDEPPSPSGDEPPSPSGDEPPPPPGVEPPPPPGVAGSEPLGSAPAKRPPRTQTAGPRRPRDPYKAVLSHYMKLFSFHTKMPVEKAALEMVEKCLDKYFQRLCNDLEVFSAHASRKTVKPEDLELLMRRQGLVTDQVSMHVLVERNLPLEYRQLLIPCASSGNSVFPVQ